MDVTLEDGRTLREYRVLKVGADVSTKIESR
jgi:hypothetical protein